MKVVVGFVLQNWLVSWVGDSSLPAVVTESLSPFLHTPHSENAPVCRSTSGQRFLSAVSVFQRVVKTTSPSDLRCSFPLQQVLTLLAAMVELCNRQKFLLFFSSSLILVALPPASYCFWMSLDCLSATGYLNRRRGCCHHCSSPRDLDEGSNEVQPMLALVLSCELHMRPWEKRRPSMPLLGTLEKRTRQTTSHFHYSLG